MFLTAEAVAHAALVREESRGAHTRLDFPGEQKEWQEVHVVVRKGQGDSMEVLKEATADAPDELSKIARSTLEELEGAQE